MKQPVKENGVWKCPICGFRAMSRRVVEMHIKREHKEKIEQKQVPSRKKQQPRHLPPWGHDYVSEWSGRRVRLLLINNEYLEGILYAEPEGRFHIKLVTDDGRQYIITKGLILYYELIE